LPGCTGSLHCSRAADDVLISTTECGAIILHLFMEPFFQPLERVVLPSGEVEWIGFELRSSIDSISTWLCNWLLRDQHIIFATYRESQPMRMGPALLHLVNQRLARAYQLREVQFELLYASTEFPPRRKWRTQSLGAYRRSGSSDPADCRRSNSLLAAAVLPLRGAGSVVTLGIG
jgi:hypothetical protein